MPSRSSRSRPALRTSSNEPTGSASLTAIGGMLTALPDPARHRERGWLACERGDRSPARSRERAPEYDDWCEFRIVKHYHEPRALERRLAALGFQIKARLTANGSILYADGS